MFNNQQLLVRQGKACSLHLIKTLGVIPDTVIDVGAQVGTMELYNTFPESHHILIEPVKEQETHLINICRQLPNAQYLIAAASDETGKGILRLARNCMFASLQNNPPPPDDEEASNREIDKIRLDDLIEIANIKGQVLIKVDVDGQELRVLNGAKQLLKQACYVVIESTIFGQIHDVITFMHENDFVLYDILELCYRPLDGALWQTDLAFVPRDSILMRNPAYADSQTLSRMHVESR